MATVVFALPRAVPGDPLDQLISDDTSTIVDPSEREQLAEHYGLDQPMVTQYGRFLGGVITGDLGWSLSKHDDVRSVVVARLPWTLLLVGPALALSTLLGFVAGLVAAWGHGRRVDRVLVGLFALLRSIPDFVIATVVLLAFAVWLPWFPVAGARTPFRSDASWWSDAGDISRHAVLPVVALTLALVGVIPRWAGAAWGGIGPSWASRGRWRSGAWRNVASAGATASHQSRPRPTVQAAMVTVRCSRGDRRESAVLAR